MRREITPALFQAKTRPGQTTKLINLDLIFLRNHEGGKGHDQSQQRTLSWSLGGAVGFLFRNNSPVRGRKKEGNRMAWEDDPWIAEAGGITEEFFQNHRETMPEDPHEVWDENEVSYFAYSFVLWGAQTKFKLRHEKEFLARADEYRQNIQSFIDVSARGWADESKVTLPNYSTYLQRESVYLPSLMKSSASLLRTVTGITMRDPCKLFLENACKRFIYSESDFAKIIGPWLVEKNIDLQRRLTMD
jgi:hypothetical protein